MVLKLSVSSSNFQRFSSDSGSYFDRFLVYTFFCCSFNSVCAKPGSVSCECLSIFSSFQLIFSLAVLTIEIRSNLADLKLIVVLFFLCILMVIGSSFFLCN